MHYKTSSDDGGSAFYCVGIDSILFGVPLMVVERMVIGLAVAMRQTKVEKLLMGQPEPEMEG
jgi:hypothetical protein